MSGKNTLVPQDHPTLKLFKKDRKYFFSITDDAGASILHSNGYSRKKSRDNGIQTLFNNLDNIEKKGAGGKYQFIVKARNNQELASSRSFTSAEKMENAINFIYESFQLAEPLLTPNSSPAQEKPAKADLQDLPPKYNFRLEFYPPEEGEPLRGKMEYLFKKKKISLKGIDIHAIEAFLKAHLPHEAQEDGSDPEPSEKKPVRLGRKINPQVSIPSSYLNFHIIDKDTRVKDNLVYRKNAQILIQLNVEDAIAHWETHPEMTVSVFGLSMETGNKFLLVTRQVSAADLPFIEIPLDLKSLPSTGLFKLELIAKMAPQERSITPFHMAGTKLIEAY